MITLLHQLKARAAKLQSWISKYNKIKSLMRRWALELTRVEGEIERLELIAASEVPVQLSFDFSMPAEEKPAPQPKKQTVRYQIRTGSEWHSTEKRGAMVTVNGEPIYKALKPICQEWEDIGRKGTHGKWCTAEYEIPVGTRVKFVATANNKPSIESEFVVGDAGSKDVDVEGYRYRAGLRICGWIVCLDDD